MNKIVKSVQGKEEPKIFIKILSYFSLAILPLNLAKFSVDFYGLEELGNYKQKPGHSQDGISKRRHFPYKMGTQRPIRSG